MPANSILFIGIELTAMYDLFYIAIAIAFFLVAAAYVRGCERLRGQASDE